MESKSKNSTLFLFICTLFCTCILIANTCAFKLINLGPFVITSGVLVFPITYIVNDLVAEVYGFQKAKILIWLGFIMNLLMVLYYKLAIILPYPEFFTGQEAFESVLGGTWRVLAASFLAYLLGSFMNATIMSKMKVKTQGKGLMLRAVVSTLFGEALDSIVFIFIAFAFSYDIITLIIMVGTQTLVKTLYEVVIFPVTSLIIRKVKKYEGIDTFDKNVKYNPFKIKEVSNG